MAINQAYNLTNDQYNCFIANCYPEQDLFCGPEKTNHVNSPVLNHWYLACHPYVERCEEHEVRTVRSKLPIQLQDPSFVAATLFCRIKGKKGGFVACSLFSRLFETILKYLKITLLLSIFEKKEAKVLLS